MRFLFYSHDGLGLGHTRRHLGVAAALTELAPQASILLVTGAEEVTQLGLGAHIEVLKLPGLRKIADGKYASRRLDIPSREIRALRAALLLAAVKSFRPNVTLVDKHPFGAGGEFHKGLKALRKLGGRAVLGLRDILDEPAHVLAEWRPYRMQHRIAEHYDQVLIYGDRVVFDPVSAYAFPTSLAEKTRFCGYVLNRADPEGLANFQWPFPSRKTRTRPVVLATAGGGEDGYCMLEIFIRAAAAAPWHGVAIAGPMTPPAELKQLQELAAECGVTLRTFVPHLSALFGELDALVSMGGYNTLVESVAAGVPTVCIPRVEPRSEQLIRARAFAQLGLVQICPPDRLNPPALREQIGTALTTPASFIKTRAQTALTFEGGKRAAQCLLSLARLKPDNIQRTEETFAPAAVEV